MGQSYPLELELAERDASLGLPAETVPGGSGTGSPPVSPVHEGAHLVHPFQKLGAGVHGTPCANARS